MSTAPETTPEADRARNVRRATRRWAAIALIVGVAVTGTWLAWMLRHVDAWRDVFAILARGESGSNAMDSDVATGPERFPKIELVDGLLDPPLTLERIQGWSKEVLAPFTAPDGSGLMLRGREGRYDALDPDLDARASLRTRGYAFRIVSLPSPHGLTVAVAIVAPENTDAAAEVAVGLDTRGGTTWRWEATERSIRSLAIAYDRDGPSGVVLGVGGQQGVVALDLDGHPLWDVPKHYVAYEVRTHPRLPGRVLFTSGRFTLFDGAGRVLSTSEGRLPESDRGRDSREMFCKSGVLFPGSDGDAVMVLAGKRHAPDRPVLVRTDGSDHDAWTATPGSEIDEMELIEPPGRPRLLVATTESGELLVVDEDGVLRARVRMPDCPEGKRIATYALAAGRWGRDGFVVFVRLLKATYVYRLHAERLPAR